MKIEIWSDYACPFCYLGKARLENALSALELKDQVAISYRSFQLDPGATSHPGVSIHELVAKKYGITAEQAKTSNAGIASQGVDEGIQYDFDAIVAGNTSLAHEITKYAATVGLEQSVVKAFFKGYFEQGADLANTDVLLQLAMEAGLDSNAVKGIIADRPFAEAVVADEEEAERLGSSAVPFFVINDKYGVSGAQKTGYFVQVLNKILTEQ